MGGIYQKLLIISIAFLLVTISALSNDNYQDLTASEVYSQAGTNPYEAYEELYQRFQAASEKNDVALQLLLGRYLERLSFHIRDQEKLSHWAEVVENLGSTMEKIPLDLDYELFKINRALVNKENKKAWKVLQSIQPKIPEKDTLHLLGWHLNTATYYKNNKDIANALKHIYTMKKINAARNQHIEARINLLHADVLWRTGKYDKSLEKFKSAENYFLSQQEHIMLQSMYVNVIGLSEAMNNPELRREYIQKYRALNEKIPSIYKSLVIEENNTFFLIRDQKYKEALNQADRATQVANEIGGDPSHSFYLKGLAFRGLNDYDSSAYYMERAYSLADSLGHNGKRSFYSHALYQTYLWRDKNKQALEWFTRHIQYRDSVINEKKAKEVEVLESKLETLEKEKEIEFLETKADIQAQKNRLLWIAIITSILLALALIYAQYQRSKKQKLSQKAEIARMNKEKEKLQLQLEHKQKEIASHLLNMSKKNSLLQELKEGINEIEDSESRRKAAELNRIIDRNINSDKEWNTFAEMFKSLNSEFMTKIKDASHSSLTSNDMKMVSLIKMNLDSSEIASILNISMEGVKKARYRLRKKLEISSNTQTDEFILNL